MGELASDGISIPVAVGGNSVLVAASVKVGTTVSVGEIVGAGDGISVERTGEAVVTFSFRSRDKQPERIDTNESEITAFLNIGTPSMAGRSD